MENARKGPVEAESKQSGIWEQSGGVSKSPPQFMLASSPIQKQEAGGPLAADKAPTSAGGFTIGAPTRPSITHDNGFLDAFDEVTGIGDERYKERAPTLSDYASRIYWLTKLEGARLLRPDLHDATDAYDHFLNGFGSDRTFNYDSYAEDDSSGASTIHDAILHTVKQAEVLCPVGGTVNITSRAFTTGSSGPFSMPYPATENWQKAIGGHTIWLSATVTSVRFGDQLGYTMTFTLHAEDRYNFNPGQEDIATGTPDADNGIFEITKLAEQYTQYATASRNVTWHKGATASPVITLTGGR
jgi:hypothetical protein